MNPEHRPNIITVGLLAGAITQLFVFAWNANVPTQLGPGEAAAITTILTALAQYLDRSSKRATEHVLTKYGPDA